MRASIALTGQYAAVDEELTGKENLIFFGRLAGLKASDALPAPRNFLSASIWLAPPTAWFRHTRAACAGG